MFQFRDDQPHLKPPVSQMYVPDHLMPHISADTLDTLSDNCRAQMSDMKRLRHIRTAVINNDSFGLRRLIYREFRILFHFSQIGCQKLCFHIKINESGLYHLRFRKDRAVLQIFYYILRDHKGGFFVGFGSRHSAVALKFAEIRAVGYCHLSIFRIVSGLFKGRG